MSKINIIVYGAGGFIGKNLVAELAKNTEYSILAFDRFSSTIDSHQTYFDQFNNVTICRGDFLNRSDVEESLTGIDYAFHLVSTTTPASAMLDPYVDIDTNVRSSIQLFEASVKKSVKKVVFLSSGGTVYGDIDSRQITEDSVTKPKSPYGIGKLTIENYLRYFKATHELDYVVYRIANPYGPYQNIYAKQGVIPIFIQQILNNEPVTLYGEGKMLRDYIFVEDVAKMIVASFRENNKYSEYNIGSGIGRSVIEILHLLEDLTSLKPEIIRKETPASYVHSSVLDIYRFVSEFGKQNITELNTGLKRTLDYVKSTKS